VYGYDYDDGVCVMFIVKDYTTGSPIGIGVEDTEDSKPKNGCR